jgi:hypothetical protein
VPSFEYRNGQLVPVEDVVISESGELHENIDRTLVIENGATVTSYGTINGTVQLTAGTTFDARGTINGTVNVQRDAVANFHAGLNGTLNVNQGGVARLAPAAVSLGAKHIDGTLINEGVRGVQVSGSGTVEDRPGSTVRQPDEVRPGGGVVYRGK